MAICHPAIRVTPLNNESTRLAHHEAGVNSGFDFKRLNRPAEQKPRLSFREELEVANATGGNEVSVTDPIGSGISKLS